MPKKPTPPATPEPEPSRKPMVVQIRGSEGWKAWIEALAAHEGDTVAKFVERLARRYAKENGLADPPKR